MKKLEWSVGEEFRILTVSLDPEESPGVASRTKQRYIKKYDRAPAANGWHFLTGDEARPQLAESDTFASGTTRATQAQRVRPGHGWQWHGWQCTGGFAGCRTGGFGAWRSARAGVCWETAAAALGRRSLRWPLASPTSMRVLVLSALVAILSGCGARSELGLWSSGGDGGAADAAGQPDAAPDAPPPPSGCRASLQRGAPTPMQGYCSTRANLAPLPIAELRPEVRWSVPLGGSKDPRDMVVDPSGRTYLVVDLSDDSAVVPRTVMALGPDGELAWTRTFPDPVGGPLLLDDGLLRVWQYGVPPSLISLDASGTVANQLALPQAARPHPAVGTDGSLVFALMDYTADHAGIAKIDPDGRLEWSHPELGRFWASVASDAGGRSVLGTSGEVSGTTAVMAFDAGGSELWRRVLDGYGSGGPVIGPDGSVVVSLGRDSLSAAAVVWLDAEGEVVRDIDLGVAPTTVPEDLVVTEDGVVIARTWSEVVALSPTGSVLWRRNVHPNLIYDAFAGQAGGLVITSGDIFAVEVATGAEIWQVVPSDPFSCVSPVVLSVGGALVAGQCDGSVFLARP